MLRIFLSQFFFSVWTVSKGPVWYGKISIGILWPLYPFSFFSLGMNLYWKLPVIKKIKIWAFLFDICVFNVKYLSNFIWNTFFWINDDTAFLILALLLSVFKDSQWKTYFQLCISYLVFQQKYSKLLHTPYIILSFWI